MHSFAVKAPHAEELLESNTLMKYIHSAARLAKTAEAIRVFETGNYKDFEILNDSSYRGAQWSAKYFGGAIEFLAETFFQVFGAKFNIQDVKSIDDFDGFETDSGVDHKGTSIWEQKLGNTRVATPLAPVFIQTKGVLNPKKEFMTNDGARLPNFFMNAQVQALHLGRSYSARYILFTTGKGIHYKLDNNSGNICEVINYGKICKLVDNNIPFWDIMRDKMSVPAHFVGYDALGKTDPEAEWNISMNRNDICGNK
jgi:hypothetical protein